AHQNRPEPTPSKSPLLTTSQCIVYKNSRHLVGHLVGPRGLAETDFGPWSRMMTGCRFLLSGVFVALIVPSFAAGAVPAQRNSTRIKLEPCKIPNLNEEGRCGTLEVYEDREARSGRKISLNILVLPALNPKPAPDPVFFLEGGPGVSAVNTAKSGGRKGLINRWRTP